MVKPLLRRRIRSERGAELIEFALVLPILLLVFAASWTSRLMFQRFLDVNNAAREGARIAVATRLHADRRAEPRDRTSVQQGTYGTTGVTDDGAHAASLDPDGGGPTPRFRRRRSP